MISDIAVLDNIRVHKTSRVLEGQRSMFNKFAVLIVSY